MSARNHWTALRQRKISRRTMLGASAKAGVGAAGLALVGCGDDDEPDAGAVAAERAAAAAEEAAAAAVAAGEARAADSEAAAAVAAEAADAAADAADAAGEASAAASQAADAADAAAALAAEAAESEDAANAAAAAEAAAAAAADAAAAASAAGDQAAAAVAAAAAEAAEAAAQAARDAAAAVEAGTATAAAAQAAIDNAAEAAAAAAAAAGEASAAAGQAAAAAGQAAATAQETAEAAAETAAAAVAAAEEAADAAGEAADTAATAAESASAAQATAAAALRGPRVRIPWANVNGTGPGTALGVNQHALWCIFDNLVGYDASLTPQPDRSLAESWEVPDPLNVIFNIRENVQFHDGLPLTAEAVRLWVERGKTLEASVIAGDLSAVGSVEDTDTLTSTWRLDRPFSPLLWILGDRAGMIMSPNAFDDFTELNSRNAPVGTGAHVHVEEARDGPWVMDANPNYWKPNAPHVEGVTYFQGASGQPQVSGGEVVAGLLAGDYDIVFGPIAEDHDRIRDAGFGLIVQPSNVLPFFDINPNIEPWTNPHARHAWNAGFDRTALNDTVFGGYNTPVLWGWLGPATIYHDPDERFWEFDPEVVQMHLNAGGFEDGFEFDVSVNAADLFATNQALFAQASLANFGITMNIEAKPSSDYWRGFMTSMDGSFFGGMSARADIWLQLAWNLIAGGVHDHALPPDKDPEVQDAFRKVEETFELEPRTEAMRELNRLAESRSYDIKTHYRTEAIAHDPGLQFEFFGDVKFHLGQDDIRWVT